MVTLSPTQAQELIEAQSLPRVENDSFVTTGQIEELLGNVTNNILNNIGQTVNAALVSVKPSFYFDFQQLQRTIDVGTTDEKEQEVKRLDSVLKEMNLNLRDVAKQLGGSFSAVEQILNKVQANEEKKLIAEKTVEELRNQGQLAYINEQGEVVKETEKERLLRRREIDEELKDLQRRLRFLNKSETLTPAQQQEFTNITERRDVLETRRGEINASLPERSGGLPTPRILTDVIETYIKGPLGGMVAAVQGIYETFDYFTFGLPTLLKDKVFMPLFSNLKSLFVGLFEGFGDKVGGIFEFFFQKFLVGFLFTGILNIFAGLGKFLLLIPGLKSALGLLTKTLGTVLGVGSVARAAPGLTTLGGSGGSQQRGGVRGGVVPGGGSQRSGTKLTRGLGRVARGGTFALGGYAVDQGSEYLQNKVGADTNAGTAIDIAGQAAEYALYGAGVGSIIPVVGTSVGAAVGGGIGFAKGLYENRDKIFPKITSFFNKGAAAQGEQAAAELAQAQAQSTNITNNISNVSTQNISTSNTSVVTGRIDNNNPDTENVR